MDELRIITKNKFENKIINDNINKSIVSSENRLNNINYNNQSDYSPKIFNLFEYKSIKAHESDILSLICYKNFLITGSSDKIIKIWAIDSGELLNTLEAHTGGVYALSIWKDKLVSGSSDKTIRIWDINSGKLLTSILAHTNQIYSLFCENDILVSSSIDKTIKVWNLSDKKIIGQINLEYGSWTNFIYKENIYCGLSDGSLRIFNLKNMNMVMSCKEHNSAITALKIEDNKIYTVSKDRTIKIWDLESLNILESFTVNSVIWTVFKEYEYLFLGGDDKYLKVLDIENKKISQNILSHNDWISQVISCKQRIISADGQGFLKFWSKNPVNTCENIDLNIDSLDKSPFETDEEYNVRRLESYNLLAKRIVDYDYIKIGSIKLISEQYDFENSIFPVSLNLTCEKIIRLSKLEKNLFSTIYIDKSSAEKLHKSNPIYNLYIKYYFESNSLKFELCLIFLDEKYVISQFFKKPDNVSSKKTDLKKDRLDIKINKPDNTFEKALYISKHDCNTIVLSDTFRKPFEDYSDFENRVTNKLIDYKYINCGKVNLFADKYSIQDQKFPMKVIFTCDKLLNIININVESTQKNEDKNNLKQLINTNKYEFYGCIFVDRHLAKKLFESSVFQNLYINFLAKENKLFYELFIIFDNTKFFIM